MRTGVVAAIGLVLMGCEQTWTPPDHPSPILIDGPSECAAHTWRQQGNRAAWLALSQACNFGFATGPIVKTPPALNNPAYICSFTYLPGTQSAKAAEMIVDICRTRGTADKPVVPTKYNACLLTSLRQISNDEQITEMEARCLDWSSKPDTASGFRCLPFDVAGSGCVP